MNAGASVGAAARWRPFLFGVLLLGVLLLAYGPAIRADFIWNDSDYVTAPALRSVDGLRRIWVEVGATEQYYPLLHSAFWLEHRLWGDSPIGYHLVNILLHAGAAWLFAALLRRLGVRGAELAAWLFALHPVCVESVAWISEQKNTLSLVFFLGAALAYLRFDDERYAEPRRAHRSYGWAGALFFCALLSKTTTATLPAVLLVIAWWRRGRIEWRRDVAPLVSWFIVGAAMGLFSAWVEKNFIGAQGSEFALSLAQRIVLAGRIVWFYLGKLVLPIDLIFIYPRWTIDATAVGQWLFSLGLVATVALLWAVRRRNRTPLAVGLLFVGSLFPVLGFFNVYAFLFSFVADHWQYLPCLAIFAAAGGALSRLPRFAGVLMVLPLGLLTWRQSGMYADMDTFYRTTIERNPGAWMAQNNLGSILRLAGRFDEAIAHYEAALRLKPDSAKAQANLGNTYRDKRRPAEAIPPYAAAVALEPDNASYHDNLAAALREAHRPAEALPHHRAALRLDPNSDAVHNNYGVTLRELGHPDEALAQFEIAARLNPASAPAHLNLMLSLWQLGRIEEAIRHYHEARRLNPAIPALDLSAPPR